MRREIREGRKGGREGVGRCRKVREGDKDSLIFFIRKGNKPPERGEGK